jgi:hypothetical protein
MMRGVGMIISECFLVMRDREESLLLAEDADTVFKWCASILTWVFKDVVFFWFFLAMSYRCLFCWDRLLSTWALDNDMLVSKKAM